MTSGSSSGTGPSVLQVESNPVLDIAGAQLAAIGMPVIGILPLGQNQQAGGDHARWLEIDRRQAAARPIIDALIEGTDVILGDGWDDLPSARSKVRATAKPAIPLVSAVRTGLVMPHTSRGLTCSPAVDIIAGQALALRILAELRLEWDDRDPDPIHLDAELTAAQLSTSAGGHQYAIPPAGLFATADAPIFINSGSDDAFQSLLRLFNRRDLLEDFRYKSEAARLHNGDALHALLEPYLMLESSETWLEEFERYGIPACLAPDPAPVDTYSTPLVSAEIVLELGFRAEQVAGWQQRGVIGPDCSHAPPHVAASTPGS